MPAEPRVLELRARHEALRRGASRRRSGARGMGGDGGRPLGLARAGPAPPAASGGTTHTQSGGMKSQAVLSLGAGMPGASGDEKVRGVPTAPRLAKLPGDVPCAAVEGLSPSGGSCQAVGPDAGWVIGGRRRQSGAAASRPAAFVVDVVIAFPPQLGAVAARGPKARRPATSR
jgi:hypothetical protein